ncbi:uncharacterized protein LOC123011680 [Tribolium madens]|uniref:uncharacterized protein LOC123011680 n=1 Tax=Tribolium madens TaxID=41895 RepID=UPI001CF72A56|nr:uncharacterized protein LOC123011680 [Tribolium madens]
MKLLLISLCFAFCQSAKILGVFNHAGASHTSVGKVLLKNLAKRGHQVTMISSYPMKEPIDNYRDIFLVENLEDFKQREKMYFVKDKHSELETLRNMTLTHTENTFKNAQVQQLLASKTHFDLVIIDWFFNEASLIFGHVFHAPVIYVSSFGNTLFLNDFTGNTLPFSYVPGAALFTSEEMSFKNRVIMTLLNLGYNLFLPRRNQAQFEILQRYFEHPPSVEELKENIALVLAVSHFSFETPRPHTPSIIPVGGFHIDELKQLPQDLEKFLKSAKNGAIFFSLGSQIKSANLQKNTLSGIIKALGKLPQKILWKFENENVTDLPKNIKIVKWAPQLEILAHPNVKLFISHCGTLSFIESIHFNKPLLCLPFIGDQLTNAAFALSRQFGAHLSPDDITEDNLFNKTTEVLTNPIYRKKMGFYSSLLREQPMKPMDLAIFWVEHVIKHGTGDHLKTFATKLPWYKYYLVDVIGFFFCVVFIVVKIVLFVIRFVVRKIRKLFKPKNVMRVCGIFLVFVVIFNVDCARILGIFHFPSKSHHILGSKLLKTLAEKGHDVTMISPYPFRTKIKNYRDIFVEEMLDYKQEKLQQFLGPNNTFLTQFTMTLNIFYNLSDIILSHQQVKNLKSEKFDLVIQFPLFSESLLGLANHWNAPVILFNTLWLVPALDRITGNPSPPSYIPLTNPHFAPSAEMTFFQRVINTLTVWMDYCIMSRIFHTQQESLLRKHFPDAPTLQHLIVALVFVNTHYSIENPRPYVPNVVQVGGLHVDNPKKLPPELGEFLDGAKSGAVFFSLGSNVKISSLSSGQLGAILTVLGRLEMRVLFKSDEELINVPKNVKIGGWLPQNDILGHPNVKLFISHGGMLSTIEAVFHGVPIIGIPIFGDQRKNIDDCVGKGFAIKLELSDLNEETFSKAIKEILDNSKYRENVQLRSSLIKSEPIKPLDKAVHWVEHVLKYKGAEHLKNASTKLNLLQYLLIDVVVFIFTVLFLVLLIFYKSVKIILILIRKMTKKTKTE